MKIVKLEEIGYTGTLPEPGAASERRGKSSSLQYEVSTEGSTRVLIISGSKDTETHVDDQYTLRRYLTNIRKEILDEENRFEALNQMLAGFSLLTGDDLLASDVPTKNSKEDKEVDRPLSPINGKIANSLSHCTPWDQTDLESTLQEIVDYDEGELG